MIVSFKNKLAQYFYEGLSSKETRQFPPQLHRTVIKKFQLLDNAEQLDDLRIPPGNQLEALTGNRKGQHSIRINDQWRICFVWTSEGPRDVEIIDYH